MSDERARDYCSICGRKILVGEMCYGVKRNAALLFSGNTICKDCIEPENYESPRADVRPVARGRWVKIYEDGEPAVAQHQVGVCCSKCMKMPEDKFTESDFCPRCGAYMKGEIGGEE